MTDYKDWTAADKKNLVMDRICRVLKSTPPGHEECILGRDAQRIVDSWFRTQNSHFAGKTPEECLDMEFEDLLDYIDYLEKHFLHETSASSEPSSAGVRVRHGQAT